MKKMFGILLAMCFLVTYTVNRIGLVPEILKVKNLNTSLSTFDIKSARVLERRKILILIWTPFHDSPAPIVEWAHLHSCDQSCVFTIDRKTFNFSDAVVFHSRDLRHGFKKTIPSNHPYNQIWVYMNQESPDACPENLHLFANKFNWTMTYRNDSDIYFPYGHIIAKPPSNLNVTEHPDYTVLLHKKKKLAAWIVSNCHATSKRKEYVTQLQKYISVDIYGSCGSLKCSRAGEGCLPQVAESYKFYLSFENAICSEYITEKFFNAVKYNIVPVVYGGGNYTSIAPPHSFIDVADFESPKKLAEYLLYLDKNVDEYLRYFDWKANYYVDPSHGWCTLCEKMIQQKIQPERKVYPELWNWWHNIYSVNNNMQEPNVPSKLKQKACADPNNPYANRRVRYNYHKNGTLP